MKLFLRYSIILVFALFILSNCEDPVPDDYKEIILVEALLIVNSPIENIRLTRTLPLNEPYYYGNAIIKNANIFIYDGENEIQLKYKEYDSANIKQSGYYYENTDYKVKPNTEYKLKILLDNGNEITGTTTTPSQIEWIKDIDSVIPYPDDTLNLPVYHGGRTEWSKSDAETAFYIYSVTCLDTLEYGKYLTPPTEELNRRIRIRNNNNDNSPRSVEVTINSGSFINTMAFNWNSCRWFGKHRLKIFAPDKNYEIWFMYYLMLSNFDSKSYSVNGAAGYFGSATLIETEFFLQKNIHASGK